MPNVILLLAQIVTILIAARVAGAAMRRIGQPQVVGEMLAGIALGPSIFGVVAPEAWATLFPPSSLGFLNTLSQLGLILFMFLVGLELDTRSVRERGGAALMISWASIAAPFALGAALAVFLHGSLAPPDVPLLPFALFLGAAMSVTAFPVLARLLDERGLTRTPLGAMAIACAAVDDVSAWLILAVVVTIARAGMATSLWVTVGGTALYVAFMIGVVRPLLTRFRGRIVAGTEVSQHGIAILLIGVFVSAATTELLGIHALFGAFLAGAILPRDAGFRNALAVRFEDLMVAIFLPIFFAFTGLRTELGLVAAGGDFLALFLVLAVAVAGKWGATAVTGRLVGLSWRSAAALGALMNTRGLMELVILNIGLDIGVISPALFAMMVVMALSTTFMTTPALVRLTRGLSDARLTDEPGGAPGVHS